jgi:hypothetical protein
VTHDELRRTMRLFGIPLFALAISCSRSTPPVEPAPRTTSTPASTAPGINATAAASNHPGASVIGSSCTPDAETTKTGCSEGQSCLPYREATARPGVRAATARPVSRQCGGASSAPIAARATPIAVRVICVTRRGPRASIAALWRRDRRRAARRPRPKRRSGELSR